MRLTELEPHFVRYETKIEAFPIAVGDEATWRERGCPTEERIGPRQYTVPIDSFGEAQGIWFLCPKCFLANGGAKGTHCCDVTFADRGALPEQGSHGDNGEPTRWTVSGSNYEDLTTLPSILIKGGCGWHGYITNGEVSII